MLYNGMTFNNMVGLGGGRSKQFFVNQMDVQEIQLEMGGMAAETDTGGVQMNVVPKTGGNIFAGAANFDFTNGDLQADNLSDALKARGLTTVTKLKKVYDYGGGFGGPLKQDKLWFYTAHRWWGSQEWAAGQVFQPEPGRTDLCARSEPPGAHRFLSAGQFGPRPVGGDRQANVYVLTRQAAQLQLQPVCRISGPDVRDPRSITRTSASGWDRRRGCIRRPIACCSKPGPPTCATGPSRNSSRKWV